MYLKCVMQNIKENLKVQNIYISIYWYCLKYGVCHLEIESLVHA